MPESWRAQMGRPTFSLLVFDKGGTLIDFRAMWCEWATEMARRLGSCLGFAITDLFFKALGFSPVSGWIDPLGPLTVLPVEGLRGFTHCANVA